MSAYGTLVLSANEKMPKARAAALNGPWQLDDGLAEAHTSLAVIAQNFDWDWQTAEKEYRRAIQLDPNYATAHHWYAEYLGLEGASTRLSSKWASARQLDPLSLIIASDSGVIPVSPASMTRAMERFRGALDMDPNFPRAHTIALRLRAAGAVRRLRSN